MSEQPQASTTVPAVGTVLGKYRLSQLLEQRGPMNLFLAEGAQASQRYWVWTLALPDLAPEDHVVYLGYFQHEASRLLNMQHSNLLALNDYGISQGIPFLVSAYVPVRPLTQLLREKGPLDPLLSSRYLDQIAGVLDYIHQQSMRHLNLTTDCLWLRADNRLFLSELGIAYILGIGARLAATYPEDKRKVALSTICDVQGQPLYSFSDISTPPPELLHGNPVNATDIYGLGAVIYRMLTGHRVFSASSPDELVRKHLELPPPTLRQWRSDLRPEVDKLLEMALAKDPAKRFQHAGAFADAYHQVVAPNDAMRQPPVTPVPPFVEPSTAGPVSLRPVAPQRPAAADQSAAIARRRLLMLGVVGTGVAAVTVVTIFALRSPASNNGTPGAVSATPTTPGGNKTTVTTKIEGTVLAQTTDVPINSAKAFPLAGSNNPGLLIHLPDKRFVAFNSTCTHAGCAVAYNAKSELLECPCHGAAFDPAKGAEVVQGPAPSPLQAIPITVQSNGSITTKGN